MRSFFVLLGLGVALLTVAIVVRSGIFMRANPGEPMNAAMRQALAGVAYQWPEADAARLARDFPGANDTPNGARYIVTRPGSGQATPEKGRTVSVDYTIRFFANGEKFDSSADHGGPYNFVLGQDNALPGWTDALHEMRKGERRTVVLPYWLAYGEKGRRGKIPAKASLLLELELIDFK
jgi:FKBP-type peptidyl-prolyl cis-trans isomerase